MHLTPTTPCRPSGASTRGRPAPASGFSLLELIIAVAIVGLLAAVAVPSYSEYLRGARRTDATLSLIDLAARMERRYTETGSYAGATIATGEPSDVLASADTSEGFYRLSIVEEATTATTFTIKASRNAAKAQSGDTACGDFTLTDLELRGVTGSAPASACW